MLTFLGGMLGPWLWLSFSMFRSTGELLDRTRVSSPLLAAHSLGTALAWTVADVAIVRDGLDRVTTGRVVTFVVGPILVALHVQVARVALRSRGEHESAPVPGLSPAA